MLDDKKLGGSIKNTSEVSRAKLKEAEWGMSLYFIDFSLCGSTGNFWAYLAQI
jgi:hypothetical protein